MFIRSWHEDIREENLSYERCWGRKCYFGWRPHTVCVLTHKGVLTSTRICTKNVDQNIKSVGGGDLLIMAIFLLLQKCPVLSRTEIKNFSIWLLDREQISGHNTGIQNVQESECPASHLENEKRGFYFYFKTCSNGTEMKETIGYSFTFTYLVLTFHPTH